MRPNTHLIAVYAHPEASPSPAPLTPCRDSRLAALEAEARRLASRRRAAEAVAARCRSGGRNLPSETAEVLAARALGRARRLRWRFHHALDALWNANAFDQALRVFRERNQRRI